MILALVIGCVTAGILVATTAARPATTGSRQRSASRRAKFVATNPTHVNSSDVVSALTRAGVSDGQARFITHRAQGQGIRPFTLWLWIEQFGAEALTIVVAADLTHRDLLTHISNGTMPDLEELKLFASANGLDLDDVQDAAPTKRTMSSVKAVTRSPMPQIFAPGTYPGLQVPTHRTVILRDDLDGLGDIAA
ncbi:hypothetical protein BH09ACT12_BH09ACT12_07090 [soil metagenome]